MRAVCTNARWPSVRQVHACNKGRRFGQLRCQAQRKRETVPHSSAAAVVALDVEYMHFSISDGERMCAASVALIDDTLQPLLKTQCRPSSLPPAGAWRGGVPYQRVAAAPLRIADVASEVQRLAAGKRLIGHGLLKDMQALGINDHPDTYDTMCFPLFQNKSGSARSLRQLAAQHLGQEIQRPGQRHDPEEDAAALMQLYIEKVHPKLIEDYSLLVDWYTRKTIEQVAAWQQQQQQQPSAQAVAEDD